MVDNSLFFVGLVALKTVKRFVRASPPAPAPVEAEIPAKPLLPFGVFLKEVQCSLEKAEKALISFCSGSVGLQPYSHQTVGTDCVVLHYLFIVWIPEPSPAFYVTRSLPGQLALPVFLVLFLRPSSVLREH